ncbi:type II and III secretion system protein family protein [Dyella jiangningensis]|uniref:Type II and III secretion system protein n=1 Tax=Dyella jiangningensis TaxID=1379159 RepID=A0A328P610_9GAMM|nr:pilus assembly protein N-terminal domain-containing protein [Dyella jiangningensis]RAO77439.1 type II and III secretion system protein [Dyella jiangningensis]
MEAIKRIGKTLLLGMLVAGVGASAEPSTAAVPSATKIIPDTVSMYAGQALVQQAPGALSRVAVGDGKLLQVKVIGTKEMVMIANEPGDTSVQLWMTDGTQRSVSVHVVAGNADQAADLVGRLVGDGSGIRVNAVGGNVVMTGNDLSPGDVAKVAAIKKLYPQVLDFTSANAVDMKPMVMMQVRIMEFDKKAMSDLGIKWDSMIAGPGGGLVHDWVTNPFYRLTDPAFKGIDAAGQAVQLPLRVPGTASYFGIATSIGSQINIMEQTGNAWELAAPQLAARSGGIADFLVGGEVPIPITQGLGETTVEYKQYGIKLHIAPIVSATGDISTDIETEISRIDPSVNVQGYPGFITRRASAQLNVHEGDSIVISGLVDATASKTFDKVPGLGDVPILGSLFRSRNFQRNRTDLVIFVTPVVIDASSPRNHELIEKSDRLRDDMRKVAGSDIVD